MTNILSCIRYGGTTRKRRTDIRQDIVRYGCIFPEGDGVSSETRKRII